MAKTKARSEPAKRASAKRATRTTTGRSAAKATPAKSSRSSDTGKARRASRVAPVKKAAPPAKSRQPERKPEAAKPRAAKPAAKPASKPDVKQKPVSRDQALATIRALVEAKKQKARQPPPWPGADPHQHRAHEALDPPPGEEARAKSEIEEREQSDPEERIGHRKGGFRGVR